MTLASHAFHHLRVGSGYEEALRQVLSGGGDTDTNACIAGGLTGARCRVHKIPPQMVQAVLECDTRRGRQRPAWLRTGGDNFKVAHSLLERLTF